MSCAKCSKVTREGRQARASAQFEGFAPLELRERLGRFLKLSTITWYRSPWQGHLLEADESVGVVSMPRRAGWRDLDMVGADLRRVLAGFTPQGHVVRRLCGCWSQCHWKSGCRSRKSWLLGRLWALADVLQVGAMVPSASLLKPTAPSVSAAWHELPKDGPIG